jgi:rod shape determining protein RodA
MIEQKEGLNTIVHFIKDNLFAWVALFGLIFIGILNQFNMGENTTHILKNIAWHVIGFLIFLIFVFKVNFNKVSPQIYLFSYLFLTLMMFILAVFKKRWLVIGPLSIQPSEFLKIVLVLLFSYMVSKRRGLPLSPKDWLIFFIILIIPLLFLVVVDLDYAFIIGGMFFVFFMVLGLPKRFVVGMTVGVLIFSALLAPIAWQKLKPHQKGRIYGYLDPEKYYKTWGYQLYQSLIAIGSGGFAGQGFRQGWSTRLNYLPAKHTDLAFAVWAEAFGFLGVLFFLSLYGYLLYWGLTLSQQVKDLFGKYLIVGIVLILLWQLFFNFGGAMGLLPMTSIPQPFLSYGGSITITTYLMLSFLFNFAKRKSLFK